ncbi:MAG: glycosyltransferase family A protein, partial [Planctomycetota bacterium]
MTADPPAERLVSVIIPTRDRCEELIECLESIRRQEYQLVEVIVVDDHSEDDTAERVGREYPEVTLRTTETRRQPAFLRNLGLRAANGEFVLFLDSDSELPRPDTVSTMVRVLDANPGLGALGGEIKVNGPRQDVAYGRNVCFNGEPVAVEAPAEPPDRLVDCDYVATCNCFGRADDMRAVGGFDLYFGFGGEDVDFVVRLVGERRCAVSYATAVLHKQSPRGRNPDETARYHL